ncbi:MAG: rhomboid family intrarane serine protease [Flavipsychrobacter sp.]|nr:rhomboid family intrarane serine protease [Flavipsychrobacter sp.]
MDTGRRRSALSYIPGLANNAVLQLIIASGLSYVMLSLVWAVITLVYQDQGNFNQYILPNLAMPSTLLAFKAHWWTVVVYGWMQYPHAFFELLSNMVWLYCFGSVVQMLVGPKQIIPLFAYSLFFGGVAYVLALLLPGELGKTTAYLLGPRAGLMGMAAAAVTLTPQYRLYLTETFSIPLLVVAGVFTFLMIIGSGFYLPVIIVLLAGALTGFGYIKLLNAGYRPGQWMYQLTHKIASTVTPDEEALRRKNSAKRNEVLSKMYEPRNGVSQSRIDAILDKINQKGYNSLTAEEKETLMRVGKEK